jgi:DNA-binding transcriptional ArsR family regulator
VEDDAAVQLPPARADDLVDVGEIEGDEEQAGLVDVAVVAIDDMDLGRVRIEATAQPVRGHRAAGSAAEDHDLLPAHDDLLFARSLVAAACRAIGGARGALYGQLRNRVVARSSISGAADGASARANEDGREMPTPPPLPDDLVELMAERFRALGEPTRIKLLDHLRAGEATVGELTALIGTTGQNVSKHLVLLQRSGIVARRKQGNFAYYRIVDDGVLSLCETVCASVRQHAESLRERVRGVSTAAPGPAGALTAVRPKE